MMSLSEALFLFMIYAMIGWLWETPYVSIRKKEYINRGFLRGPYIPIYGVACLTIILTMNIFSNLEETSILTIIIQVLYISLISAVWEYGVSWTLEKLFKMRWWDYSDRALNLNGRIALDYTLLFGCGGYVLWRFINPIVLTVYKYPSGLLISILLICFYTIFTIDSIFTVKDLVRVRHILLKLETLQSEWSIKYKEVIDKANLKGRTVFSQFSEFVQKMDSVKDIKMAQFNQKLENIEHAIKSQLNIQRLFGKYSQSRTELRQFFKSLKERK
jgi:uncharacterized membrane protein